MLYVEMAEKTSPVRAVGALRRGADIFNTHERKNVSWGLIKQEKSFIVNDTPILL